MRLLPDSSPGPRLEPPNIMAKPKAQKAMPAVMKSIMFLAITLATERDLMEASLYQGEPGLHEEDHESGG